MTAPTDDWTTPSVSQWRGIVAQYQNPDVRRSVWQIVNSFGGYSCCGLPCT